MRLIVGCPAVNREWAIQQWFKHVLRAVRVAEDWLREPIDCEVVLATPFDDGTFHVLAETWRYATLTHNSSMAISRAVTSEPVRQDHREWSFVRYVHMANVRNRLLQFVRLSGADLFWSVDSDILVHAEALRVLMQSLGEHPEWAAVGGRAYLQEAPKRPIRNDLQMRRACRYVTYAKQRGHNWWREDSEGTFRVDVLMAIKLMRPEAFNVDYAAHRHGEDYGWSQNCRAAGLALGWCGAVQSKHVWNRLWLNRLDPRIGW